MIAEPRVRVVDSRELAKPGSDRGAVGHGIGREAQRVERVAPGEHPLFQWPQPDRLDGPKQAIDLLGRPRAGTLGFGVNYCSLGVIKHAGSLTLKVLAQMKSIIIILFGIAIYHDIVTAQTACGYATAIVGFGFYNYAKIKAKEEDDAALAAEIAAAEGGDGEKKPLVGEKKV